MPRKRRDPLTDTEVQARDLVDAAVKSVGGPRGWGRMSKSQQTDRVLAEAAMVVLGWVDGPTVSDAKDFIRACLAAMEAHEGYT
jgi:multimeric flavodoxin WrbA